MARDPDKEAKVAEIVTKYDGRITSVGDATITVALPANRDGEFRAHLGSEQLSVYRTARPADDNSTDTNWYTINVNPPNTPI